MITFSNFESIRGLRYGFSDRQDGSMHRHIEKANRETYFRKMGIDPGRVVTADVAHGISIVNVSSNDGGGMISSTDGLITSQKNLFLTATAADCFIIYLYSSVPVAVGIVHAGWRGILGGIIKQGIRAMADNFGSSPSNIFVGISPGIRKCHFEVSPLDEEKYREYSECISKDGSRVFVDLPGIIIKQAKDAGVSEDRIEDCGLCTYCEEKDYFSYRRDRPKEVEPMVGYIGVL
jgi:YfiH family protein